MRQLSDKEKHRVTALLAELVAIDSAVTSTEQADRDRTEERIAGYLTDHLSRMGMTVERQEVSPGRPNLIARWPGQARGARLMLEAHMDTVTAQGMTVDPFKAEIRDDRMYGRGTCDTKGSMAAILTALALAREADQLPSDELCFVAAMSEEMGCIGASALMEHGFRADAAIVGEPTRCRVVTAHKAPIWLQVETHGRSCHAATPERGVNAVDLASRVVQFVHGPWTDHIRRARHPLLRPSTSTVVMIEGGRKINIVPDRCTIDIDGRFVPAMQPDTVLADFKRMLAEHLGGQEQFTITRAQTFSPLDCPPDVPVAARLLEICHEFNGQEAPLGVDYFADTGPFDQAGIRSVLFGPGEIAQAHTCDEFIELGQLYQATEILLTLLTRHAGRSIVNENA